FAAWTGDLDAVLVPGTGQRRTGARGCGTSAVQGQLFDGRAPRDRPALRSRRIRACCRVLGTTYRGTCSSAPGRAVGAAGLGGCVCLLCPAAVRRGAG